MQVATTEQYINDSYINYGDNYVKFFSAKQINNEKIAWEEAKNLFWIGWIFTYQDFKTQTPVFCPTFMQYNKITDDPDYPFRHSGTGSKNWAAINALNPIKNSSYRCDNSPRIIELKSLGNGKYYMSTTACYEFVNITNAAWWSGVWLPDLAEVPDGSAGYKTTTAMEFEGPVQFTTGSKYNNNAAKFEIRPFRWVRSNFNWESCDIPYNMIDLKYDVLLPDFDNTYGRTNVVIASGSYIYAATYNMGPADYTYVDRWRDGGYFYTKKFSTFSKETHAYQKNDARTHLYEGLRLCSNPGKNGILEVPFIANKVKGDKFKLRFHYGPYTNTNKNGNVKIKDIDGTTVDATEVEVSGYGVTHKINLAIDKSYASNSDIYAIMIPYNGSIEYVTADPETIEYVQGIKFTGASFTFTKEN